MSNKRQHTIGFAHLFAIAGVTAALTAGGLMAPPASGAQVPAGSNTQALATHPTLGQPARHDRVLYVAPGGHDQASGSLRHPLATIQRAVDRVQGGGSVEIRGGVYAQKIALLHAVDVTVQPYRHEHVVLDGSHLAVPAGDSAMVLIADSRHVTVEGLDITGYKTTSMSSVPTGIYVHGGNFALTLRNNHVHDMGNYNKTLGDFDTNAHGIAVYGDSVQEAVRGLDIEGNEVDHLSLGASETVVVNGNVDGWRIINNRIYSNNNIGIDAIGFEPTISGRYRYTDINRARHGLIAGNVIHDIISQGNPAYYLTYKGKGFWCDCADGIYVDGGTHIVIERNQISRSDIGVEVASEHSQGSADHVDVRNNFVYDNRSVGISTGGYCDGHNDCGGGGLGRAGDPVETGQSFDNSFVNNTLFNNNTLNNGNPEFLVQYYAHDNRIMNNIIIAGDHHHALIGTVPRAGTDGRNNANIIDDNLYFTVGGDRKDATFGWVGKTYAGWAKYRERTGQDRHSRFVNPDLVSLRRRDLHLQLHSPAANAGFLLPPHVVGQWDIDHQARVRQHRIDIGADEYYRSA